MSAVALPDLRRDPSVSEEGRAIQRFSKSQLSASATRNQHLWALEEISREASTDDWDGYGGVPVSRAALRVALEVLEALPQSWPMPAISADPDGDVSLEWAANAHWVLTVSVGATGRLSYAGLFGVSKVHGAESFVGQIPQAIVDSLVRLFRGVGHFKS